MRSFCGLSLPFQKGRETAESYLSWIDPSAFPGEGSGRSGVICFGKYTFFFSFSLCIKKLPFFLTCLSSSARASELRKNRLPIPGSWDAGATPLDALDEWRARMFFLASPCARFDVGKSLVCA